MALRAANGLRLLRELKKDGASLADAGCVALLDGNRNKAPTNLILESWTILDMVERNYGGGFFGWAGAGADVVDCARPDRVEDLN